MAITNHPTFSVFKTANVLLIILIVTFSCGPGKGDFGFKQFYDDCFKKRSGLLEFSKDEEVQWVYSFSRGLGKRGIGVMYMKKEVVWVEVEGGMQSLNAGTKQVGGVIKNLPVGRYKLMVIDVHNNNRLIDEREFTIYSDDDIE